MNKQQSRRNFIAKAAAGAAVLSQIRSGAYAAGSDKIKIGLIGCGGRGTGAVKNALESAEGVELYAIADVFKDKTSLALKHWGTGVSMKPFKKQGKKSKKNKKSLEGVNVSKGRIFSGFYAYKKILKTDIDIVILATPPNFRPIHLRAAIEAGKNVFMEKPVAVDPAGVNSVIESAAMARKKKLAIVAGTQRRHDVGYNDIMKRIQDGAIGEVVGGQAYWCGGELWYNPPEKKWSEMETQIRNWLYFSWLSGDHICEQHIHNLDVMNWAFGGPPVKCIGVGGRQTRTDKKFGNIFDHFGIEYEYANGGRVLSMCRQANGATKRIGEHLTGTKGFAIPKGKIMGKKAYETPRSEVNPYVQEHTDLIASIRKGKPLNEGKRVAESTMTAIMGRMAAYTGRELSYKYALGSKLDLTPKRGFKWGKNPVDPVAIPGTTQLS